MQQQFGPKAQGSPTNLPAFGPYGYMPSMAPQQPADIAGPSNAFTPPRHAPTPPPNAGSPAAAKVPVRTSRAPSDAMNAPSPYGQAAPSPYGQAAPSPYPQAGSPGKRAASFTSAEAQNAGLYELRQRFVVYLRCSS